MSLRLVGIPEAVTFDCWNTLLYESDWPVAVARRIDALAEAAADGGHSTTRERAGAAFETAWRRHMDLWVEEVASGAAEIATWALAELGIEPDGVAYEHLVAHWQEASHSGRVLMLHGAQQTLAALRARGVRTALICDTGLTPGRVVREHLDRLGLLHHLEVLVFSDEVGVPKPKAKVFRAALEPLGVEAKLSVHVGDIKRTDVAGARGAGMQTVRIAESHDDESDLAEADQVVEGHAELRAVLGV